MLEAQSEEPSLRAVARAVGVSAMAPIGTSPSRPPRWPPLPITSFQQSIGPPGTPSNTMISQGPVVVRAGKTKYSPTPGTRLNDTAVKGFLGTIFLT